MSISLSLLKKVRCRFLCQDSSSPVSGIVATLTVGIGDPLTRIPLASLCSDNTGYISFDLKPLLDRGVVNADKLLLATPRVTDGEIDLFDILLKNNGADSKSTMLNQIDIVGITGGEVKAGLKPERGDGPSAPAPAITGGEVNTGLKQGANFCIVFPVYVSALKSADGKVSPPDCSRTPLASIQSPDACDYQASPFSFITPVTAKLGAGCCETLIPASLPVQEHRFYKVIVRREDDTEIFSKSSRLHLTSRIAEVKVTNPLVTQTPKLKFAEIIEFNQLWYSLGHSLGEIKYSLPLAPGEATQIAIIDWSRQDNISRSDSIFATEYMDHSLKRDRSIEETINSALQESQGGNSFELGTTGQATIPLQYVTLSFNHAIGGSVSNTWGDRNLAADSLQSLHDGIRQQTAYTRSLNSTVVVQASQAEQNALQTRKVANHNHSHALTIQYYEILRHYRILTEFTGRKKALLVPFELFAFTWQRALGFRSILESVLIDPSLKECFDATFRFYAAPSIYDVKTSEKITATPAEEKTPTQSKTVSTQVIVQGDAKGSFSSIFVNNGDNIKISATGEIRFAWNIGKNPDGDPGHKTDNSDSTFTAPGLVAYSLIYKIGDGPWRQAGSLNQANADRDGEIIFGVNDDDFSDNKGSWTVNVEVPSHEAGQSAPLNPTPAAGSAEATTTEVFTRENDEFLASKLLYHLNGNQGYYNSCVWVLQSPVERRMRIEAALGEYADFLDAMDDTPIAVSGNYVAFPYDGPFPSWQDSRPDDPKPLEDIVTLPTRGLFAEAQLGHCNASEERDPTRMWDWNEMTIETPPDISGVAPGPKGQAPSITPTQLPGNVIQITQPQSAPDPTGLAAALKVLGTPNIFRDMSGLDEVSKLLDTLSKESSEANIKALALRALGKLNEAKSNSSNTPNTKSTTDKTRSSASEPDSAKQVDRLKAIEYAKSKGLLDDQGAEDATKEVLGGDTLLAENGAIASDVQPTGYSVAVSTSSDSCIDLESSYQARTGKTFQFQGGAGNCLDYCKAMAAQFNVAPNGTRHEISQQEYGYGYERVSNKFNQWAFKDPSGDFGYLRDINSAEASLSRAYIDAQLNLLKPVVVGVTWNTDNEDGLNNALKVRQAVELDLYQDATKQEPPIGKIKKIAVGNYNPAVDHFVIIVGRDKSDDGEVIYRFRDPGTSNGSSPNSIGEFRVRSSDGLLYKEAADKYMGCYTARYEVAQVRENVNIVN